MMRIRLTSWSRKYLRARVPLRRRARKTHLNKSRRRRHQDFKTMKENGALDCVIEENQRK